jgi:preprotein translocase subunit SecG
LLAYFLYGLFFISCLVLVATVLLQPGKTDAGALFTSNISSTAFGPRGTQSLLSRITIGAAAVFMLSGLLLSLPAITGSVSVLQTTPEAVSEQPASATTDANAAANQANVPANATPAANTTTANQNSTNSAK